MSALLTVQGDRFVIDETDVVARIRLDIETAARNGGGFVTIGASGIEVLVTPHSAVRVQDTATTAGPDTGSAPAGEFIDFDAY